MYGLQLFNIIGNGNRFYYYGIALSENGKPQEAISYFEKVISIEPNDFSPWYNLAVTFNRTNQLEKSIDCYKKQSRLHRQNPKCSLQMD